MGLVDEGNQEQVGQEIGMRQQAAMPEIPGMAPSENNISPNGQADINSMLTPNTFRPERIDLA